MQDFQSPFTQKYTNYTLIIDYSPMLKDSERKSASRRGFDILSITVEIPVRTSRYNLAGICSGLKLH